MKRSALLSALFVSTAWTPSLAETAVPCSIDQSSMPSPSEQVELASSILHVRARSYCNSADPTCRELPSSFNSQAPRLGPPFTYFSWGATSLIDFDVLAVLKGPQVPSVISIPGTLIDEDDFNDHAPPYVFVRPGGRAGNCFALGYRPGAEYLVFLRPVEDRLTPYWAPLSPINEQVRGEQDPWLTWVRQELAR